MNRSHPLQQSGWQSPLDEIPAEVVEACACDPAFPCAADAALAKEQEWQAGMRAADPALLQLRGLMAGLGLVARPAV